MGMVEYFEELAQESGRVRHEIQALVKRGGITLDEYKSLRCNSWEWDCVHSALGDEALIAAMKHTLKNCYPRTGPCQTYGDSLAAILAPAMLNRFEALLTSQVADTEKSARAINETYIRGRTEAIVEAATFLRGAAVAQVRAMSEPGESPIQACASAIVRHEARRGQ